MGVAHLETEKLQTLFCTSLPVILPKPMKDLRLSYKYWPEITSSELLHGSYLVAPGRMHLYCRKFIHVVNHAKTPGFYQIYFHSEMADVGFCQNLQNFSEQVEFSWDILVTIAILALHSYLFQVLPPSLVANFHHNLSV